MRKPLPCYSGSPTSGFRLLDETDSALLANYFMACSKRHKDMSRSVATTSAILRLAGNTTAETQLLVSVCLHGKPSSHECGASTNLQMLREDYYQEELIDVDSH